MIGKLVEPAPSAYGCPLLIGGLLKSGVTRAPEHEIVYADKRRMTYRELGERVERLASGLARLGVGPGDTVGVMDWDTTRYLECFFAVPMMGGGAAHHQCAALPGANPLHDQSRRRRCHSSQ